MDGFHGSVLHVKEWVEGINKHISDPNIKVVSIFFDNNTKKIIEDAGSEVYDIQTFLSLDPSSKNDLIIAFHFPILERMLFSGVTAKKIINWSLSPYEPLEAYSAFWADLTLLIANSEETKIERARAQGIPVERIKVINNPLPEKFNCGLESYPTNPRRETERLRVLVVSNHVPQELSDLIQLARNKNNFSNHDETATWKDERISEGCSNSLTFVHCGQGGDIIQEVTPQLLKKFDVVVTIGKTVQYCLGVAVPVFEYDRFGGRGYINTDNYEEAKKFNFSGRPQNRILSSQDIFHELFQGYPEARRQARILQGKAFNDFSIGKQIEYLFQLLSEKKEINKDLLDGIIAPKNFVPDSIAFIAAFSYLKSDNYQLKGELNASISNVQQLQHIVKEGEEKLSRAELSFKAHEQQLQEVLRQREEELSQIRSSRAYRVALILRRLKSFITG